MTDIIAFISARLDDDEAGASDAMEGRPNGVWTFEDRSTHATFPRWIVKDELGYEVVEDHHVESQPWWTLPHIARHDPAHVLAEVKAKRALLSQAAAMRDLASATEAWFLLDEATSIERTVAAIYATHPDYDLAWRVE